MARCGPTGTTACDYRRGESHSQRGSVDRRRGGGDSGSPVFAWNTAFGIMTNAGWYGSDGNLLDRDEANGRVTHLGYTPIDEIYNRGYQLLY